jgi:hypothetical protein
MLTTHPHLVPRLRMSRSFTSYPPKRLHGVQWDLFTFFLWVLWSLRLQMSLHDHVSRRPLSTRLHGATSQKTAIPIFVVVRTWNLIYTMLVYKRSNELFISLNLHPVIQLQSVSGSYEGRMFLTASQNKLGFQNGVQSGSDPTCGKHRLPVAGCFSVMTTPAPVMKGLNRA